MESSLYKDITTSRGLKYHYYVSPSSDSKPTLLFLHGFPSTSYDWRKQVSFFKDKGYGLIVPDLLGYGGTDKPSDLELYKYSAMVLDIIDVLNAEKVEKVIPIGHDWGSFVAARLASYFPDRFVAFGFLAVNYNPPQPDFDLNTMLAYTKQVFGYELFGYWLFFAEEGSDKIIEEHLESALSIIFPADPSLWTQHLAPLGAVKAWVTSDQKTQVAPYITKEEFEEYGRIAKSNGFAGPLNWYKLMVSGLGPQDDKNIPPQNIIVQQPVFYAACKLDAVCPAALGVQTTQQTCPKATIKEYDSDHWIQLSHPEELNNDLLAWLEAISV